MAHGLNTTYKLSRYNVIFSRESGDYLWNTFSGALIRLDDDALAYIGAFDGQPDSGSYFETLVKNGCVVESCCDELSRVLVEEKETMDDDRPWGMHLTIAPGLGCNFDCTYCFERGRSSHASMSDDTQRAVLNHIIAVADSNDRLARLGITWFGGEPLLYLDTICSMSKTLISYCDGRGVSYGAGIVTNGRFLTRENAKLLATCKVGYVQMSVDGMSRLYQRKKHATRGDFDRVIDNIEAAADILPITVRINVEDDMGDAYALTDYLLHERGLDGKIKVYVAHVRDYDSRDSARERESHASFLKAEGEYMSLFGNDGPYSASSFFHVRPRRRRTTCLSVCGMNHCFGPSGELYRCEHKFGRDDAVVGTVWAMNDDSPVDRAYREFRHHRECKQCPVLPVCLGGCMNDSIECGETVIACEPYRRRLTDLLMYEYEHV